MYAGSSIRLPQVPGSERSDEECGRKDTEDAELKFHRSRFSIHTEESGILRTVTPGILLEKTAETVLKKEQQQQQQQQKRE